MLMETRHIQTVLVVDDETPIVDVLAELLSREGYQVISATDGEGGLRLAIERRPGLVLVDYAMPGMDGIELCRRLKAHPDTAQIPIVMVSGRLDGPTLAAAEGAGAVDFIKKPPDQDEVRLRVRAHLRLAAIERSQRQSVDALRASERKYVAVFQSASVGQAIVGNDDRFSEVNATFARMLGYSQEELCARRLAEITHPEDRAASLAARKDLAAGRMAVVRLEKRYLRKDGAVFWADLSIAPLRDATGGATAFVTHIVDIGQRKAAEARAKEEMLSRERMELELRHSQKLEAVGQLAAGIAHEINTPAQFVGDSLQFLKDAHEDQRRLIELYRSAIDERAAGHDSEGLLAKLRETEEEIDLEFLKQEVPASFERAREGLGRISAIVGAMREFAHPGHSEKEAADLNQAIKATLTIARNEYKYVADIETDLGELPLVECHVGDLNQVFLNLVVNAAHAIGDVVRGSTTKGRIRVSTRHEGSAVCIRIADTGTGIPEHIRTRVFEPFFTTKPVGKGSGQGLAIARAIVVDKHGGSLTFASKVGEGTTFTIRLPVGSGHAETLA
jgi:two-component system NtrC family sensor kinase